MAEETLHLINGDELFAVEVMLDAAKKEINSPATNALIDAMDALVRILKPIASPADPMHGVNYIPKH